jgi:hypothetical protein
MTVPTVGPESDPDNPDDVPEVPIADDPPEADDVEQLVPEGDLAAQQETAWPDDEDGELVPDPDRVVPDIEDD